MSTIDVRRGMGARDRTGQERLSTGSLILLLHLGMRSRPTVWKSLENFRAAYSLNEDDVLPLVKAGWVEQKGTRIKQEGSFTLQITDAGNEILRSLVAWAQMKGGAA